MIVIYEANDLIEAHLLRGLLEQRGIDVRIAGEHLLGGLGDLPAQGLLRVLVPGDRLQDARDVVHAFEEAMAGQGDPSETAWTPEGDAGA